MNYNYRIDQRPSLKIITIIHLALLIGQLMFAVVTFMVSPPITTTIDTADPLLIVVPVLAISALFGSNLLYRKLIDGVTGLNDLKSKLVRYQTASIVRYALIEGPSLFAIVAFLLSGSAVFIIIAAALMIYYFSIRPTRDKIADELQLTYEEKLAL